MIQAYDHIQIAMPEGQEAVARQFYGTLLRMAELPKPDLLRARGGCWFRSGGAVLHLGCETPFHPARKAHPCFVVDDLEATQSLLEKAGHPCVRADGERPGILRFYTSDPFGNRLEFQESEGPREQSVR